MRRRELLAAAAGLAGAAALSRPGAALTDGPADLAGGLQDLLYGGGTAEPVPVPALRAATIRARVLEARMRQRERFSTNKERIFSNAQMGPRQIRAFCELAPDAEKLLERAMVQQGLTARAHDRILKVARTIADLDDSADIQAHHISEAIQYRSLDRTAL